ncbi:MAG: Crp/Fnr family transcriptional regulator [Ignavibacteriaceae bacterium]|nr:Crp/Fnr family transcriptional regulator [Ignavibacteriaceae bacterium]
MLLNNDKILKNNFENYKNLFREIRIPAKSILLNEGEIAHKIFFIKEGCIRMGFYNKGRDITFQFFFENMPVASIESFLSNQPGQFFLESLEPSVLYCLNKKDFERIIRETPELKEYLNKLFFSRFERYSKLFLSFIRDTPEERYLELLKNEPHILQRVPQHYIASYLGITPVSLSRIRKILSTK